MKPFNNDGVELDAIFSIETTEDEVYLILESRGGGKAGSQLSRNPDYAPALELLLHRLGEQGAVLVDLEVYSSRTLAMPLEQRRIFIDEYPFPLDLSHLANRASFRVQIGRASAAFDHSDDQRGGNSTKRLRFRCIWPWAVGRTSHELERHLAGGQRFDEADPDNELRYAKIGVHLRSQPYTEVRLKLSEIERLIDHALPKDAWNHQFWATTGYHVTRRRQWLDAGYEASFEKRTETVLFKRSDSFNRRELPTADPEELNARTNSAKARIKAGQSLPKPPKGSSVVGRASTSVNRYVRDPEVIAWVLVAAAGSCEVCDTSAPFIGMDGEPFLEVHHVRPLGEGGPDQTDNAVAACPNCHRHLHYSADRDVLRSEIIKKIERLLDYPKI